MIIVLAALLGATILFFIATIVCLCCFYEVKWSPHLDLELGYSNEKHAVERALNSKTSGDLKDANLNCSGYRSWGFSSSEISPVTESPDQTCPNLEKTIPELSSRRRAPPPFTLVTDATVDASIPPGMERDIWDTFSFTKVLGDLVRKQNTSQEFVIETARDLYLRNDIHIGGVVVVVLQFAGKLPDEFPFLYPGDMLRILRFYTRDNGKTSMRGLNRDSTLERGGSDGTSPEKDQDLCRDSFFALALDESATSLGLSGDLADSNANTWCTGIILNTYIEQKGSGFLIFLREKEMDVSDLVKDFPLRLVSLETTLLQRARSDGPDRV